MAYNTKHKNKGHTVKKQTSIFSKIKFLAVPIILLLTVFMSCIVNAKIIHYYIHPIRVSDTIYFDNYSANWSSIRLYIFDRSSTGDIGLFDWSERVYLTQVSEGSSVYKYDMSNLNDEYKARLESGSYDYIIFSNDSGNQTVDLGFTGNGYAYRPDNSTGQPGYWYLYDQSAVEMKHVRKIKAGDVIYFDTTNTSWGQVYIHMFDSSGSPSTTWPGIAMTHVSGNIWSYTATNDTDYNTIIFNNGNSGGYNQTISLGFIDSGYAYKIDDYSGPGNSGFGYWYSYDKSEYSGLVNEVNNYINDNLKCLSPSTYSDLTLLIDDMNYAIGQEIPVETDPEASSNNYWSQLDTQAVKIRNAFNNLKNNYGEACKVSPTIIKTITNPKAYYQVGETVNFRIDVTNTSSISLSSVDITEYLSGVSFIAGTGYSVINSQLARTSSIGAGDTVSIYANYTVSTDATTQYTNIATITAVTPSDSNYSWNTSSAHSDSAIFNTRSQDPVPTGVNNNSATFAAVLFCSLSILSASICINVRRRA